MSGDEGGSSRRTAPLHLIRAVLLLGVGVALLAALLHQTGSVRVASLLAEADRTLLLLAALVYCSQSLLVGLRWWVALRLCGLPAGPVAILRASVMSNVVNFVAPGHFGEPAAAAWLGRTGRAPGVEAFGLLVAIKALASLLNIVVLLACLGLLAAQVPVDGGRQAWLLSGGALALTVAAFTAILHPGLAAVGTRLCARLVRAALSPFDRGIGGAEPRSLRLGRQMEDFCGRFRASFVLLARRPWALGVTLALSVFKVASLVLTVWLLYAALGTSLTTAEATLIASADAAGNLAAIWIPANLGVQEVVHTTAAAAALSIDQAVAVSGALAVKGLMVLHGLFGALLWVALSPFDRAGRRSSESD